MSDEPPQKAGWTEAGLDAVVGWFPGLPSWIKVIFASATIYLILCLVSQIPPMALPEAVVSAVRESMQAESARVSAQAAADAKERADIIKLLLDERAELRSEAAELRSTPLPDTAMRIQRLEDRADQIEEKLYRLIDSHPKVSP